MGACPGFDPDADPRGSTWSARSSSGSAAGSPAVRARLDVFGVWCWPAVVGLAGGIIRDLLIGAPPATFRDWRYLAAAGAAGLVCFFGRAGARAHPRGVLVFDAVGLAVFCVAGATKALDFGLGPVQAVILGAITGIGGGMLRDVLLGEVPTVLRHELYAIPALLGAGVVVAGSSGGQSEPGFPIFGACLCFAIRMFGMRYGIDAPIAPSERRRRADDA